MNSYVPPLPKTRTHTPSEVGLEPVDRPQIRALCDAGYLSLARYVELVTALGWHLPPEESAPEPKRLPPMAQQPWRDLPTTSVA